MRSSLESGDSVGLNFEETMSFAFVLNFVRFSNTDCISCNIHIVIFCLDTYGKFACFKIHSVKEVLQSFLKKWYDG